MKYLIVVFCLFVCSLHSYSQYSAIDSLEQLAAKAKPGWDQIDYSVGLARLYIGGAGDYDNSMRHINIIYKNAEEQNIPVARAYALVMENIFAYNIENDREKSIRTCEEAIRIGKQYNCNDVIVFAGYQLSERYRTNFGDFQKSREIIEEILTYIDETVDDKHKANAIKTYGYILTRMGEPDKGFEYMEKAISILKKMKTDPFIDPRIGRVSAQYGDIDNLLQYAYNNMSESKLRLGRTAGSEEDLKEALKLALKSGRPRIIAWQYERMGWHYISRGYYDQALDYFTKNHKILETLSLPQHIANSNAYLAQVMTKLEDYTSADKYIDNAIKYSREKSDSLFLLERLMLKATINMRRGYTDIAEMHFDEINQIINTVNNPETYGLYSTVKGEFALYKGDTDNALKDFKKAYQVYNDATNGQGRLESSFWLANTFLKLKQYDSASYYGQLAIKYGYEQSNIAYIEKAHALLSQIYEENNLYKESLENFKLFYAFHDSVFKADAQIKLKEEQVRRDVVGYQSDIKLAKDNALLLEKQNQLYLWIGVILVIILAGALFFYFKLRNAKISIEQKNKEREVLLKEIHHRVKNNLQIISSLLNIQSRKLQEGSAKKAVDEGRSRIKSMSLIHEKLYGNDELSTINMREYIDELSSFLKNTYKPKSNIQSHISVNNMALDIDTAIPLGLILNELISNSFKYAFSDNDEGAIDISLSQLEDEYILKVKDTGPGFPEDFERTRSMGMRLIHSLSEQLNGVKHFENIDGALFTLKFKMRPITAQ
ncbi:tetratricopeptide repeat-containing sensor histidine kinase [Fulvivirga lutea]|uniref:histidine kinase n=1 Tax=Fulvivirga lutea TaxID=2810512 RepID=A0A974WFX1_9BACT|nr:histidine kinase dimerization/phosphoacceptor domain -containing protein [Fulvivirga lutea]QSE97054.1 hypothetical protein JR347_15880 [Fulvivirga lutea]